MKQSERIRLSKAYREQPLREQYEAEKREISITSPLLYVYYFVKSIPIILFFVYGFLFFYGLYLDDYLDDRGMSYMIVSFVLGVVNALFVGPFIILWADDQKDNLKKDEPCCEKLKEKYEKLGLVEVSYPLRESCGEYDDDGDLICSVTGELLDYREFSWCQVKGNCEHCSKMVKAYWGDDALSWWTKEIQK